MVFLFYAGLVLFVPKMERPTSFTDVIFVTNFAYEAINYVFIGTCVIFRHDVTNFAILMSSTVARRLSEGLLQSFRGFVDKTNFKFVILQNLSDSPVEPITNVSISLRQFFFFDVVLHLFRLEFLFSRSHYKRIFRKGFGEM